MTVLQIERAGPGMSVQDLGRPGYIAEGLSRGGAMDRIALFEAAAILLAQQVTAAIEMPQVGGVFSTNAPIRFALTGAPMRADIDGDPIRWNASHILHPGQRLRVGAALSGAYGYLVPAGGIEAEEWLESRSAHFAAGVGGALSAGDSLPVGVDPRPEATLTCLPLADRFNGGVVRLLQGPQTNLFDPETLNRFLASEFRRSAQANRQGVRLDGADGFSSEHAGGLVSDFILPGDVQMTGEGVPFVLMSECQTVGGYPRIGTVLPADLARVAQAPVGAPIRFELVQPEDVATAAPPEAAIFRDLRSRVEPLIRDPRNIRDLLSY